MQVGVLGYATQERGSIWDKAQHMAQIGDLKILKAGNPQQPREAQGIARGEAKPMSTTWADVAHEMYVLECEELERQQEDEKVRAEREALVQRCVSLEAENQRLRDQHLWCRIGAAEKYDWDGDSRPYPFSDN